MLTKQDGRHWVVAVHVHRPGKDEALGCEVLLIEGRAPAGGGNCARATVSRIRITLGYHLHLRTGRSPEISKPLQKKDIFNLSF